MIDKEKTNACDFCKAEPATTLCPECCKCYCDECNGLAHRKDPKKEHKTERIPGGVNVKARCPIHDKIPLEMLCLDEVKLCCSTCIVKELHKGHRVVDITTIEQDNETFSAAEVRKEFEAILNSDTALSKKIEGVIEDINKEMLEAKGKVEEVFAEEHHKLKEEEAGLLTELEEAYRRATERLNELKTTMERGREYCEVLRKAAEDLMLDDKADNDNDKDKANDKTNDKGCSRLLELNIVSEMERQRREVERLHGTEMLDLKISWEREARKLTFTRNLFNGAPCVRGARVEGASWDGMDVAWEIDDDGIRDNDDGLKYSVEVRKEGTMDWQEGKSGVTETKCRVEGLEDNSAYEVRVRCVANEEGGLVGAWSDVARGRTLKLPVPSGIMPASTQSDAITVSWDGITGAMYEIEVDGSKAPEPSTSNTFTKRGLLPESGHSFRVRTIRGSSVSEWSSVVKGRTPWACVWKTCPGDVDNNRKYSVDGGNPRVATKINSTGYYCTIIGDTHIPLNKVTQWNIRILESMNNNGNEICIGIAPNDINQNDDNYNNGWYFYCWGSTLRSGPPHKYDDKKYGPRKESNGQYVHTGDSVGVVVDTTKGDLSFILNGTNRGVAYCGIPLDKPLVPCVLLFIKGDSVEIVI